MATKYRPAYSTFVAYTEGDCWNLALAIHKLTGLPIITTAFGVRENWEHVAVLKDGLVLDIAGLRPLEEWKEEWGPNTIEFKTKEEFKPFYSWSRRWFKTKTSRVARRLIETYLA